MSKNTEDIDITKVS